VLVELAGLIQTRAESPFGTSGLVVAGFGSGQPFPALSEYEVYADLNAEYRGYILQILEQAFDHVSNELRDGVDRVSRNRFAAPIIDTVSALPKHELAEMAEALINLASFRKRVSPDLETVGGPADVAVISKGDGFVWIKRKHRFRSDRNAGFHANSTSLQALLP
jgi:hypothetical protein